MGTRGSWTFGLRLGPSPSHYLPTPTLQILSLRTGTELCHQFFWFFQVEMVDYGTSQLHNLVSQFLYTYGLPWWGSLSTQYIYKYTYICVSVVQLCPSGSL